MNGPFLFAGASATAVHVRISKMPVLMFVMHYRPTAAGMLAWCCPCILVGNIAETLGEDKTLCTLGALFGILFVPAVYVAIRVLIRSKLRDQKGIGVSAADTVLPQLTTILSHHTRAV